MWSKKVTILIEDILMDLSFQKKIISILNVLYDAGKPLGGTRVAQKLYEFGYDLSQRTVRYYLKKMDNDGLTLNLGKRGRTITPKGEKELKSAFVIDKVGFVAARIDTLIYQMDFSLRRPRGKIILNLSSINRKDMEKAAQQIQPVFRAGLGMGRYIVVEPSGARIGNKVVGEGKMAVGTVCSVTINGIFIKEGIQTTSRFGGILELYRGRPLRFTEIIHYDGTSLDPLEIFIKGRMTSVRQAVLTGNGKIGASFREIPAVAVQRVEKIRKKLEEIGLGGILMIGKPGHSLLDIPVPEGRVGVIVAGGLNPIAAVEEYGIPTENIAMETLFDFDRMVPFWEMEKYH